MKQKRFDKKNLIVLAMLVLVIAATGVIAAMQRGEMADVSGKAAYLGITVAGEVYEPIRLEEDSSYSITRGDMVNVVAVTKDSVMMQSSTCDNQDCVLQGIVTMDNRADRVLQNMIICLPNEVMLELFTEEEARELYPNAFVDTEAANE